MHANDNLNDCIYFSHGPSCHDSSYDVLDAGNIAFFRQSLQLAFLDHARDLLEHLGKAEFQFLSLAIPKLLCDFVHNAIKRWLDDCSLDV